MKIAPLPPDTRTLETFKHDAESIYHEMTELLTRKRESYGTDNLTRRGLAGILIRMEDKIERLYSMLEKETTITAVGESTFDAWRDLIGYATLGLMGAERALDAQRESDEREKRRANAAKVGEKAAFPVDPAAEWTTEAG